MNPKGHPIQDIDGFGFGSGDGFGSGFGDGFGDGDGSGNGDGTWEDSKMPKNKNKV